MKGIFHLLDSLRNLTTEEWEAVFVDDSTDGTTEVLTRYCRSESRAVLLAEAHARTPAEARNKGVAHCRANTVAFVDANYSFDKDWLEKALIHLREPVVAGVGGGVVLDPKNPYAEALSSWLGSMNSPVFSKCNQVRGTSFLRAQNIVLKRAVFLEVGGFDPEMRFCEDEDLSYRIRQRGYRLLLTDSNVTHHWNVRSFKDFSCLMLTYGLGRCLAARHCGLALSNSRLVLPLSFASFVVALIFGTLYWDFALAFALLTLYLLTVLTYALATRLSSARSVAEAVFLYVLGHLSYSLGFFSAFMPSGIRKRIVVAG